MVEVGFAAEQQLNAVPLPPCWNFEAACQEKRRLTVLDAKGLRRPLVSE